MEVSTRGQGEDMAQKEATRTLANLCMVREGAQPAPYDLLRNMLLSGCSSVAASTAAL